MDHTPRADRPDAEDVATTTTTERGKSTAPDVVLSMVAHEHRRAVLRILNHTDTDVMAVSTLIERVTEHVQSGDQSADEHRQRVRTALHHIHLPKLDACGMIVHDPETNQVRNVTGEPSQELLTTLESYTAHE
ncbi:DUF7344 domain-containing protein [Natronorubrum thiooxidans]|uniref:DUF7344 domain-containing protein n=1 Tax=Natronorubrum thiooxidans TaxID=308853 RepID=A0A1N7CE30_9EURY|nr:hypothetical protein [Natronorubrum thiooxidans]SIR61727.1 hypothetical protein SAMN05421752_101282 [Natronorubrum thiooxidans]